VPLSRRRELVPGKRLRDEVGGGRGRRPARVGDVRGRPRGRPRDAPRDVPGDVRESREPRVDEVRAVRVRRRRVLVRRVRRGVRVIRVRRVFAATCRPSATAEPERMDAKSRSFANTASPRKRFGPTARRTKPYEPYDSSERTSYVPPPERKGSEVSAPKEPSVPGYVPGYMPGTFVPGTSPVDASTAKGCGGMTRALPTRVFPAHMSSTARAASATADSAPLRVTKRCVWPGFNSRSG
jgi:hypothetical protein